MKQFVFLLLAAVVLVSGCQPAPIIINNQDDECHEHHHRPQFIERERPPVIIERQPPVIIERRPPIIIEQRPPVIINGCTPHHHCGNCPVCRANGWIGINIRIR